MTIEKKIIGSEMLLSLTGRLDTMTAPDLEQTVCEDMGDIEKLVIDCEKLEYISSAGLRVLLKAHKKMSALGGMTLLHVNEENMEVFAVTGFDSILHIEA